MSGGLLVWCPFPAEEEARRVAGALLDEELVACANLIGPMTSLFRWEGERQESTEMGVLFKTHPRLRADMTARLAQLHSYTSPAIMIWEADAFPPATASWLADLGGS
ncbi:divalent-cation tolerance protein CutA [Alteraurantiacibacter palmitatis]|uniref:Divalent-cation tolerance protein CutA n=1 Tax=Alteraurantiacibacter palmitatis TaxID=2054628 RepID=A0ABV7E264_9SPHN